jgi:hypothetical protein
MQSIHRSILLRLLMAGAASLAFMMVGSGGVRAELVTVQGDDGAADADGVNPVDPGLPGGNGESVAANAGSTQPMTAPLNKAMATGGNGGAGGNGLAGGNGNGGDGGNGGTSNATASTTIVSGSAEADAYSHGGSGGAGGGAGDGDFGSAGTGGTGGDATAQSSATNSSAGPVLSSATAVAASTAYPAPAGQEAELPLLQQVGQRTAP